MSANLRIFRYVAFAEGVSYILFGITMPLKYLYEIPEPNFYVGMAHGLLFGVYCLLLLMVGIDKRWTLLKMALVFAASFVPFGTFIADKPLFNEKRTIR